MAAVTNKQACVQHEQQYEVMNCISCLATFELELFVTGCFATSMKALMSTTASNQERLCTKMQRQKCAAAAGESEKP